MKRLYTASSVAFLGFQTNFQPIQCALQDQFKDEIEFPGQLLQIQVIHRHAARTPLTTRYWEGVQWSNCSRIYLGVETSIRNKQGGGPRPTSNFDLKQENTLFPGGCSMGTLTEEGQRQALQFGLFLRERYIEKYKLISTLQDKTQIYLQSTNYRRTLSTLHGILAGLYPKVETSQPFLILTSSDDQEYLTANEQLCKKYGQYLNAMVPLDDRWEVTQRTKDKYNKNWSQMISDIRKTMGISTDEKIHWMDLYDSIYSVEFHNKKQKYDFSQEQKDFINHEAINRFYHWLAGSPSELQDSYPDLTKLTQGIVINELLDNIYKYINNLQGHKIMIYSGHDTTVVPILKALDHKLELWIPFLSNVIIELWVADNVQPASNKQPQQKAQNIGPKNILANSMNVDQGKDNQVIEQQQKQQQQKLTQQQQQQLQAQTETSLQQTDKQVQQLKNQQQEQGEQVQLPKQDTGKEQVKVYEPSKEHNKDVKGTAQVQQDYSQKGKTQPSLNSKEKAQDQKKDANAKQIELVPRQDFEQGKYYVRILYNQEPLILKKDGKAQGQFILLEDFTDKLQKYTYQLKDMKSICAAQN